MQSVEEKKGAVVYHDDQQGIDAHHARGSVDEEHGDHALKVLGDERIELTEDDVSKLEWYGGDRRS